MNRLVFYDNRRQQAIWYRLNPGVERIVLQCRFVRVTICAELCLASHILCSHEFGEGISYLFSETDVFLDALVRGCHQIK